jgi:branched-chain amino acid transport system substrate-binding protein
MDPRAIHPYSRRALSGLLALALGLLLSAGCQTVPFKPLRTPTPPPTPETGCTIKIGIINSVQLARGVEIARGYEMARDEINAAGGIGGCPLSLVEKDDGNDPALAEAEAEDLIAVEQVPILLGSSSTALTLPIAQQANRRRVPLVAPISTSMLLTEVGYDSVFRLSATSESLVQLALEWLRSVSDPRAMPSVAIVFQSNLSGASIASAFLTETEKQGISVVAYERYNPRATDFTPLLNRLGSVNPDVLFVSADLAPDLALLLKQIGDMKLSPKALVGIGGAFSDSAFLKNGKYAEYTLNTAQWSADVGWTDEHGKRADTFVEAFQARYGDPPRNRSIQAYVSLKVAKLAVETALSQGSGDLARRTAQVLRTLEVENTLFGPVRFDAKGQNHHQALMVQVIEGQLVTVFPDSSKARSAVFPAPPWNKR